MARAARPHCPFHLREAHLPPALRKPRKPGPPLPPPARSARLLVRLAPEDTALFRFLLEGYDNTAYFTVLEPRAALLKLVFSPHREEALRRALAEMAESLSFTVEDWPTDRGRDRSPDSTPDDAASHLPGGAPDSAPSAARP
ncbi:DUF4911 domain-containing protein [uncultured Desulfovibrio sp.]|uniref:DUF4911 domain-containing protein n=1 Tax=uncultured Desulfovibrio sp. TaxID=167968 RepID=UPI0034406376